MVETGMIRRVDELGRVVIPKEMRKTFRIKEGEPLEIFADKENLILRKYSPIEEAKDYAQSVGQALFEITEKAVIITDRDKVIFSSNKSKEILGKHLAFDTEKAISDRKNVMHARTDGNEIPPAYKGEETGEIYSRITVPIVSGGDAFGAIILSDKSKESSANTEDVKMVRLCATILAKRFE